MLTGLLVEFGPAEIADTFAVRPLAMYLGPLLIGHLAAGILAGKIAADIVFYALAIVGYELFKAATARRDDPFAPDVLDQLRHRTPYLLMDLGRVSAAYRTLADALPVDAIHYAVKCNPDRRVLAALHAQGCRFEVASFPELARAQSTRRQAGRRPVQQPGQAAGAHRRRAPRGLLAVRRRRAAELDKLAAHAPGIRRVRAAAGARSARERRAQRGQVRRRRRRPRTRCCLRRAERGLRPYGLTFHVGSQMTTPSAWADAIDEAGVLMDKLAGGRHPAGDARHRRRLPGPLHRPGAARVRVRRR